MLRISLESVIIVIKIKNILCSDTFVSEMNRILSIVQLRVYPRVGMAIDLLFFFFYLKDVFPVQKTIASEIIS